MNPPTERAVAPLGYQPALDGVRGIAIALVVAFHAWNWPRMGGGLGVEVFFVLSGFLITSLLVEEFARAGQISLRHFYIRRALRLLPLLYAVLAIAAVVVAVGVSTDRTYHLESILASAFYVGNFFGFISSHSDLARPVAHLWSLAVEEQFYVVWPVLLLLLLQWASGRRAGLRPVVGVTVGLIAACVLVRAALVQGDRSSWTLPTTYGDALFAGALLAFARRAGLFDRLGAAARRWLSLAAVAVLVASAFVPHVELADAAGLLYLWPALVGILLVSAAVVPTPSLRRVLEHPWLVYVGIISYGLYILHPMVLYIVEGWSLGVRTEVGVVLSVLIAAASRRWFESWFLRRKPKETTTTEQVTTAQDAQVQPEPAG